MGRLPILAQTSCRAGLLIVCASLLSSSFFVSGQEPDVFIIYGVPYRYQEHPYWCGPACLVMVLGYWGVNQTQARVAESVYSVAAGATSTDGMESYPRKLTFRSESSLADINYVKHWVRQGVPVIVLQRFDETSETGHYRVVIGYDDNKGEIITYDPIRGERFNLTYGAFAQLWQPGRDILRANWSLVIRPTSDELAALAWHLQTLLNTSPSDDPLVAYVRQELLGDFRAVCSAYVSAMDRASSEESKLLLALVSTAVAGLLIGSAGTLVLCLSKPKK